MSSKLVMRGMIGFYVFLFFAYLFGPLDGDEHHGLQYAKLSAGLSV